MTSKYEENELALASGVKVQFYRDDINRANEAWLWSHNYQPCELYVQNTSMFPIGQGLRRFGYVFWDSSRLQTSGLLQRELVHSKVLIWLGIDFE